MPEMIEVSLSLPESWFALPLGRDADLVAWAGETAYAAWRLRADAGVPESAVLPGAGERLVVELTGLAASVHEQVTLGEDAFAAVWLPMPELGVVNAVVVGQVADRSPERSPDTFVDTLLALADGPDLEHAVMHTQPLSAEIPLGDVRGLHAMIAVVQPDTGVSALEERTTFGVFPPDVDTYMVEVLFASERAASFGDMPTETLALLSALEVRAVERT